MSRPTPGDAHPRLQRATGTTVLRHAHTHTCLIRLSELPIDSTLCRVVLLCAADLVCALVENNSAMHGLCACGFDQDHFAVESDAVVVVELLTAIAIRNPHRTSRVWPVLHQHFQRLLSASPDKREYLLERVCVNLMRGCASMPPTDDVVFSSLTMLTQLRPDTTEIVAPRIAAVRPATPLQLIAIEICVCVSVRVCVWVGIDS